MLRRSYKRKNNPNYKNGVTFRKYYCIKCDKKISLSSGLYGQQLCNSCAHKGKKKPPFSIKHKKAISRALKGNKYAMGNIVSEETKRKMSLGMKGVNNPHWKNGKMLIRGYVYILKPDHPYIGRNKRYVLEHRLLIEKQIGRYLKPQERTHHINKIKTDNRLENLMAFVNQSAHRRFEMFPYYEGVDANEIIFDGRLKTKNGRFLNFNEIKEYLERELAKLKMS